MAVMSTCGEINLEALLRLSRHGRGCAFLTLRYSGIQLFGSRRRYLAVLSFPRPRSLADYRHQTAWYHGDSLFHHVVSYALQQMNPTAIYFSNVRLLLLFGFVFVAGTWRRLRLHWTQLLICLAIFKDLKLNVWWLFWSFSVKSSSTTFGANEMHASSETLGWIKTFFQSGGSWHAWSAYFPFAGVFFISLLAGVVFLAPIRYS